MAFALLENGKIAQYPIEPAAIRQLFANVSFPSELKEEDLPMLGVVSVTPTPEPSFDFRMQKVVEGFPVNDSGQWKQSWNVVDLSIEDKNEIENSYAARARNARNYRLSQCDWTQLPDAPVNHSAWAQYRQDLRDITAQPGFPWEIHWPNEPVA